MKTIRTALAVAALAAALTACGGDPAPAPAADPAASSAAPSGVAVPPVDDSTATGPEAAVRSAFLAYNAALGARDYAAACALNAPETSKQLMDALTAQGIPAGSCEEAFAAVLAVPKAAASTDEVVRSVMITGVTVTGDTATIDWTAQTQGRPKATKSSMQQVDGSWLLLSSAS